MIGCKLTILSIVLTVMVYIVTRVIYLTLDDDVKFYIKIGELPKWWCFMCSILGILLFLDAVGIVYSTIWVLFIR